MTELTYRQRREERFRWEELIPLMTIHAQSSSNPLATLKTLEERHHCIIGWAHLVGISIRTIRRRFLDDPRKPDTAIRAGINAALAERNLHPGRPKRKLLNLQKGAPQ